MASTAVSWVLTLAIIGGAVYVYQPDLFRGGALQTPTVATDTKSSTKQPTKKSKTKKNKTDIGGSVPTEADAEATSGKKRKVAQPATAKGTSSSVEAAPARASRGDVEDMGDKEFAQQFAKAQSGTNLQNSDKSKSKGDRKAVKQKQAKQLEPEPVEAENSATEQSGDDGWTAVEAPQTTISKSGDVSDMLEAPAAKPTTLRLTNVADDNKQQKKKSTPKFEETQTKKQRQQQAKKEALKQMKEDSDRIHEAKKQQQLRAARTAAGTSNQVKANNFTNNVNAWQNKPKVEAEDSSINVGTEPSLLDTFEPTKQNLPQPNGAVTTRKMASSDIDSAADAREKMGDAQASAILASSREALNSSSAANSSQVDEWESVSSKKSKKKSKPDNDTGSETGTSLPRPTNANKIQTNGTESSYAQRSIPVSSNNRFNFAQTMSTSQTTMDDAEWEA